MHLDNPFQIIGYHGPDLFCDRKKETESLLSNAKNGINTTLVSIRRMGKTGLLQHVLTKYSAKSKQIGIYVDIYATQNLKEFTTALATAIYSQCPSKTTIAKKFTIILKSLRAVFSFDSLTGEQKLSFDISDKHNFEHTLEAMFSFLENQHIHVLLAIDEFQQICNYPEKNIEAKLRSIIQHLKNVTCIFSGSSQHVLIEMFNNSKRPFFASTQFLHLTHINPEVYSAFIKHIFDSHHRKISNKALEHILDFTKVHTFYTQRLCNKIYASGIKKIELHDVQLISAELLHESEIIFFQYRTLLTPIQWNLLKSIAKEGTLYNPMSQKFISKYKLGTAATIQRPMASLLEKEMIYSESSGSGIGYNVYDCFLSRWLEGK